MKDITIRELGEQDVLALAEASGEPDWLRDRRLEAFKAFSDLEWPHNRIEEWRYTDPRRFDLERPVLRTAGPAPAIDRGIAHAAGQLAASAHIVDGAVAEISVGAGAAELGVVVADLSTAAREHPDIVRAHLGTAVGPETKLDAANLAAHTGGLLVWVPAGVELVDPIAVLVHATGDGTTLPRVLVVLGAHARAAVYVDHSGDADATVVEVTETVVGEGAHAEVVSVQDWGDRVDHIGTHRGVVERSGEYRQLEVSLGGKTMYLRPDVRFDGEGASGELLGVYFTDEGQHMEHRSLVHHNASHTSSESMFKGALQGRSRAAWYGNIRIEPHAKGTSSDETNRNLILSEGARADSIPFLEILTSDVASCGHHSSVGQLDELQLFYLESRGIPRPEAVRMLVFGFFGEVVDRIDLPGVAETVLGEIEAEIEHGDLAVADPRRSRPVPGADERVEKGTP